MNPQQTLAALNRLLHVLCRSLPMYLVEAAPFTRRDDQPTQEALAHVVTDQRLYAQRVTRAILARGGRPDPGRFPIQFTAVNDLELQFLHRRLIECQRRDLQALQGCVDELKHVPDLESLAEEAIGNARGHLDILDEIMNHGS